MKFDSNLLQPKKKEALIFFDSKEVNGDIFFQLYHDNQNRAVLSQNYPSSLQQLVEFQMSLVEEFANKRGQEYESVTNNFNGRMRSIYLNNRIQFLLDLIERCMEDSILQMVHSNILCMVNKIESEFHYRLNINFDRLFRNVVTRKMYNVTRNDICRSKDKSLYDYQTGSLVTSIVPRILMEVNDFIDQEIRLNLYSGCNNVSESDQMYHNIQKYVFETMQILESSIFSLCVPFLVKINRVYSVYGPLQNRRSIEDDYCGYYED